MLRRTWQGRNDGPDQGTPGQMGAGWCPYTSFRTSGDILNMWDRVMSNLMTVVPFLGSATEPPLSRRSCWAYADMLEVGRMPEHNAAESRSHFSAWAVVSSPLTLGKPQDALGLCNRLLFSLKLSQHRYAAQLAARLRQHTPITATVC